METALVVFNWIMLIMSFIGLFRAIYYEQTKTMFISGILLFFMVYLMFFYAPPTT